MPSTPFAAVFLAASPWLPGWACMWLATATVSVALAQQSHAWAHMRKSELPATIVALQVCLDAEFLVPGVYSCAGARHRATMLSAQLKRDLRLQRLPFERRAHHTWRIQR